MSILVQVRSGVGTLTGWGGGILALFSGPGPLSFVATESIANQIVASGTLLAGEGGIFIPPGGGTGPTYALNAITSQASSDPRMPRNQPPTNTALDPSFHVSANPRDERLFVPGIPPHPMMVGAAAALSGVVPPGMQNAGQPIIGAAPWPVPPAPFVPPTPIGQVSLGFVTITFTAQVQVGDFTLTVNGE